MRKAREYRRELTHWEKELIQNLHEHPPRIGGFLSKNQRLRLLGKKKKERATEESDFWYSVRKCAEGALLDLELFCKIAHDNQLRELFKPLDADEQRSIDILIGSKKWSDYPKNEYPHVNGKYDRTDFRRVMTAVLDKPANTPSDEWKDEFAVDLVNAGISYLEPIPKIRRRQNLAVITVKYQLFPYKT